MMRLHLFYENSIKSGWLLILIGLFSSNSINAYEPSHVLPCDYADSINITNGVLHPNKSYVLFGMEFPEDHYAKIDYTVVEEKTIPQLPYIRGCLCNVKKCIRFCCPYGSYLELKNTAGICRRHGSARNINGEIVGENNKTQRIKFHEHFAVLHKYPCQDLHLTNDQFVITHVRISKNTKNQRYINETTNQRNKNLSIRKVRLSYKTKRCNTTTIA